MNLSVKSLLFACSPSFIRSALDRIEKSPLGYRLAKGVFWSMVGAVISRGLMLAASIFVARILGKTGFGEFGMVRTTVGMFGVFAGFGLGLTATKHVAEYRECDPEKAGRIIGLSGMFAFLTGGLITLVLYFSAPWLAVHTINAPHLADVLRVGALILFINALNGAQTGALSGFEAFKAIARVNLAVGLISFPLLVTGAHFWGLTGVVWALAINLGFNWLFNHLALRKEAKRFGVPFALRGCMREWPVLWRFSLPAVLSGALVSPVNWACSAILVNQPGGYGEMGIFNAANQWSMAILFIPNMLSQVALPLLSNLNSEQDSIKYHRILLINIFLSASVSMLVVLPLLPSAKIIMRAHGPGFEEGELVFIILTTTAVLIAINAVIGQAIASKGKMWMGFLFNTLWAIVILITAFNLLSKGFGALGLAYSTLTAYIFHTIWQGIYLIKIK